MSEERIAKDRAKEFLLTKRQDFPMLPLAYVYIMRLGGWGPVKIGVAVSPELRRCEFQCGNWQEVGIAALIAFSEGNPLLVEAQAHRLAKDVRVRGEWFDLDPLEAVGCVLTAAEELEAEAMTVAEARRFKRKLAAEQWGRHVENRQAEVRRKLGVDN